MPEVELVGPNRLNLGGVLYLKGVKVPVDMGLAFALSANPRFRVHGLNARDAAAYASRETRPRGADLHAAINEAADGLDVDDDNNFDRSGKASADAISRVLGYTVTAEERDAAMAAPKPKIEAADGGSRVIKPSLKVKSATPPGIPAPAAERSLPLDT